MNLATPEVHLDALLTMNAKVRDIVVETNIALDKVDALVNQALPRIAQLMKVGII